MKLIGMVALGLLLPGFAFAATTINYGGVTVTVEDNGNFSGGGRTGYIDIPTGQFRMNALPGEVSVGGAFYGELGRLPGAVVSTDVAGGGTVSTVIDRDHPYEYHKAMFTAGVNYVSAYNNNDAAGMQAAVAIATDYIGTQHSLTITNNSNGSINYGCDNIQNSTITLGRVTPVVPPALPPAPSVSVSAPSVVEIPGSVRVSWSSSNASDCSGWGEWAVSGLSGAQTIWDPTVSAQRGSHTFGVTCSGPGGSASDSASTRVMHVPQCSFAANPTSIIPPQESVLSWRCQYADACSITSGIGAVNPASGSRSVRPQVTTAYILTCSNLDGSRSFPASVLIGTTAVPGTAGTPTTSGTAGTPTTPTTPTVPAGTSGATGGSGTLGGSGTSGTTGTPGTITTPTTPTPTIQIHEVLP